MKVGQGQGRAAEELRAQAQRGAGSQARARGAKEQRFSDLLERRSSMKGEDGVGRARYGEEGRRLQGGDVQREGREAVAQLLDRTGRGVEVGERTQQEVLKGDCAEEPWELGSVEEHLERVSSGGEEESVDLEAVEPRWELGPKEVENGGPAQVDAAAQGSEAAARVEAARMDGGEESLEGIARQIVKAVQVGEDAQARRVMFLEVTVPGHGDVRIRLRRDGGGMEVRMRADNDGLAQTLRQYSGRLRSGASEQGLRLTSIQVVR